MFLIQNIIDNYRFVKNDFIGWNIDPQVFVQFFFCLLISLFLFTTFYFIGRKLRNKFFSDQKQYTFFIDILLGYVLTGTGIGLLGVFSLFRSEVIITYLFILFLIGIFPFSFSTLKNNVNAFFKQKIFVRQNLLTLGVSLFVLISFFRLFTPEIGEDGYHTDFPRFYLSWQSTIHTSREVQHVLSYPQLPEMIYTIPIIFGEKEAVRFIHFSFYLLIILLLVAVSKEKKYSFAKFAPLLFITTPAVIKYAPAQFTDFLAIFPFFLAVLLIKKNMSTRSVILAGICFGAVVSAKIWMLVYLPLLLIYLVLLNKHLLKKQLFTMILIFIASYLLVAILWHIRTVIIMGSPIYPILNTRETPEIYPLPRVAFSGYFGLNWYMFTPGNLGVLSPLFFLGILFSLLHYRALFAVVKKSPLFLFAIFFTLEQLVIQVGWGRYLLTWFIFVSIIISAGIVLTLQKSKIARVIVIGLYLVLFSYYAINTVFLLSYGLGFANKNHFLSRTLIRQNGNYYDFDNVFDKHITRNDLVGMYGMVNFYYANFSYIDVGYIFDKQQTSFDLLQKSHVTKLFIYGGDMKWFCKQLSLKNCDAGKYKRIATYPQGWEIYNLYEITN